MDNKKQIKTLRPLKKGKKPKKYAVVDTETWGLGGKLAFGVVYISDVDYHVFYDKEEFYKILEKQNIQTVYAHNLDFDAIKIRDQTSLEGTTDALFAGGLLLTFKDEKGIKWHDSYCLLKSNASKLGEAIGYKKLPTPKKFINPRKSKYIGKKDIYYCKRDCKIIAEFLQTAFKLIGTQKLTIASAAMFIFRKNYLEKDLIIRPENELFRHSYYGGRVECFRLGKVNAEVVDINSLYPWAMKKTVFPHPSYMLTEEKPNFRAAMVTIFNYEGMAEIEIYHPKRKIGLLPYRHNGKLIFPYGLIRGYYNFNELRFAIKNGCKIKKVYSMVYSKVKLKGFFNDFVNDFYFKKNNSQGAEKLFYKFILNSLYGKFGENKHTKRIYIKASQLNKNVKYLQKVKAKFKIEQLKRGYYYIDYIKENDKPPIHQIFSLCSYITSTARIKLNENLIKNENQVVYCDTDSMAIQGKYKGEVSNNLGSWSYENYVIQRIVGNKFYKTDKGLKAKGVPKSAKLVGRQFNYDHFIKSKESLKRGLKAGSTENRNKKVSFDYDKRKAKRNGETEILNVNELIN